MENKKVACSQSPAPLLATKQTDKELSGPGCLLTPHPQVADKESPRAGNLHLLGTEEVSLSWTCEPSTGLIWIAHSTCKAALKFDDVLQAVLKDDDVVEDALDALDTLDGHETTTTSTRVTLYSDFLVYSDYSKSLILTLFPSGTVFKMCIQH